MNANLALVLDPGNAMAAEVRAKMRLTTGDFIGAKADLDLMPKHEFYHREV